MIVIARNYGQLGNRLCLAAHLIAASREYGVPLLNPSFVEYARYFRATADDLWCRYPQLGATPGANSDGPRRSPSQLRRKMTYHSVYLGARLLSPIRLKRLPIRSLRLSAEESIDLDGEQFRRLATSSRLLLVSGWRFRSHRLLQKHLPVIRDYFRLIPEHHDRVGQLVSSLRKDCDCLVGVHIRHGDYATWQGGKYFYPVTEYVRVMRSIRNRFPSARVKFLVCGNSRLQRGDFEDLDVAFGSGHLVEDMYSFAKTDYLVGPPSTYTRWASLYGGVPLEAIEEIGQELKLTELQQAVRAA